MEGKDIFIEEAMGKIQKIISTLQGKKKKQQEQT